MATARERLSSRSDKREMTAKRICVAQMGLANDAEDDASSTPGSVFVRWTVPLLGDLEPEAKPPPEIVAASAR